MSLSLRACDHFHTESQHGVEMWGSDPAWCTKCGFCVWWFLPCLYYECLLLMSFSAGTLRPPLKGSASSKDLSLFFPCASNHHPTGYSLQWFPGWTLPLCLSNTYEVRVWISSRVSCSCDSQEHILPLRGSADVWHGSHKLAKYVYI